MSLAQGIDVSVFQKTVNWTRVAGAGIAFVFVRCSFAGVVDGMFAKHWPGAKAAGLLRGAYHFLVPNLDPRKQAEVFINALTPDPGELPPVLDLEEGSAKITSAAQYAEFALAWLTAVEGALGTRPILYTGAGFWDFKMPVNGQFPAWAASYPLWVASYPMRDGAPPLDQLVAGKFKPRMPKSWTAHTIWQYSERGRVDGVTDPTGAPANVDLNVFRGSFDELKAWAQPQSVPLVDIRAYTNMQVITAFVRAFGRNGSRVLDDTGLLPALTGAPSANYAGPAIADIPTLTPEQELALSSALRETTAG
jgi:lysozyme